MVSFVPRRSSRVVSQYIYIRYFPLVLSPHIYVQVSLYLSYYFNNCSRWVPPRRMEHKGVSSIIEAYAESTLPLRVMLRGFEVMIFIITADRGGMASWESAKQGVFIDDFSLKKKKFLRYLAQRGGFFSQSFVFLFWAPQETCSR